MNPERWRQAQTIFESVIEAPPEDRQRILLSSCGSDQELLRAVRSLLSADDEIQLLADEIPVKALYQEVADEMAERWLGRSLGSYEIVRLVGRGGMSLVFEAHRTDDVFDKRVAVKIMSASAAPGRFHRERQILADLEHPDIARVLDGGTTPDGLPYVVMELVQGLPLLEFCRTASLDLEDRLRLTRRICEAVSHAHRNLVVHRDLKPSNILVTSEGQPKLLDFGIAKLLTPDDEGPAATAFADRALTPNYASPEQLAGKPVTTATDVYSLGVLIFESVTGELPFARSSAPTGSQEHLQVADHPPPASLTLASRTVSDGWPIAPRDLRGDIDKILVKAMMPSPEDRYRSVERLADDLDNYLDGRPVEAQTPGFGYRLSKFVRRHPVALSVASLVIVVLTALAIFHNRRIEQERDVSTQALEFLVGTFEGADPTVNPARDITARDILTQSAIRLQKQSDLSPEVRSVLSYNLGRVFANLESWEEARSWLERSIELTEIQKGRDARELGLPLGELAGVLLSLDKYEEAEAAGLRALELLPPTKAAARVRTFHSIAESYAARADWERSGELHLSALALARTNLAESDPQFVSTLNAAVKVARRADDLEAAMELNAEALALEERYRPGDSPSTSRLLTSLGRLALLGEDLPRASKVTQSGLDMRRRIYGPNHATVARSLKQLGAIRAQQGDLEEASRFFQESLEVFNETLGENSFQTIGGRYDYARFLHYEVGDPVRAEPEYRSALKTFERLPGMGMHPNLAAILCELAQALNDQERNPEAEPIWRRSLGILESLENDEESWYARVGLAESLERQDKLDEAQAYFSQVFEAAKAAGKLSENDGQNAGKGLARLHERVGKPALAAELRAELVATTKDPEAP